jgi:prevent-host-death family protein
LIGGQKGAFGNPARFGSSARISCYFNYFDYILAMSTTYRNIPEPAMRLAEMPTISATELKNATADVFEKVATHRAVAITRHDKPRAVLLSVAHYQALAGQENPEWLEKLHEEYRGLLDSMQGPEQRAAAERAFNATPEELGEAAVWWAAEQKKKAGRVE